MASFVVGPYPDLGQHLDQLLHGVDAVVHTGEQHGLVAQRHTGVGQTGAGLGGLPGDLLWMVEVGVEPHGVVLLEHGAQFGGDTLGAHHRRAGAQSDDLHMGYLPQAGDDVLQHLVREHQHVAAGEKDIPDGRGLPDVCDTLVDLLHRDAGVVLAGKAAAGAVAAVHGALVGGQHQHPVRIAVGEAGCRGVGVLMKGVQQVGGAPAELLGGGDGLPPDGVMGIVGINEGEVVGGNGHAQGAQTGPDARLLLGRQGDVFLQILQGLGPVGHLPAPVVPVGVGHIGEKLLTARFVREDHMGRPPFMGLGHRPYRYFCSK